MPRVLFTVTEEMHEDLKKAAKKRGATISGLVRLYVAEHLAADMSKNADKYEVDRGGDRRRNKPKGDSD